MRQDPDAEGLERHDWVVTGQVQGVGFRYATLQQADPLGIRGSATNRPDGSVHVIGIAAPGALDQLDAWLRHGPRHADVTQVTRERRAASDADTARYQHFETR